MCSHLPVFWISWNLPSWTLGSMVLYSSFSLFMILNSTVSQTLQTWLSQITTPPVDSSLSRTSRARYVLPVWPIQYLYHEFILSHHLKILMITLILWCFSFSICQGEQIPYESQELWCRDSLELVKKGFSHLPWSSSLQHYSSDSSLQVRYFCSEPQLTSPTRAQPFEGPSFLSCFWNKLVLNNFQ